MTLVAHRVGDRSAAMELRRLIAGLDANLPVLEAKSLSEDGDGPVQTQLRIGATVAASVGLIGLFLAGVGIYGVTAYAVAQRTREIGVRLSLGASRGDVIWMVLRDGMRLVALGAVLGLLLGLGAGRLLSSSRYGLPQFDPITLTVAVLLLTIVGLVACYAPVRRAARIKAMEALRYE
jgi:putative ABC transport system permease protein